MAENEGSLPPTEMKTAEERLVELTSREYRRTNKIDLEQIESYDPASISIPFFDDDGAKGDVVRFFPDGLEVYDGRNDYCLLVQGRKLMVSYERDTDE